MIKRIFISLLFACSFISCHKAQQQVQTPCGTQVCTDLFAIITIKFTDKNGNAMTVQNYSVTNQRTHLKIVNTSSAVINMIYGSYIVADDNAKSQLSTDGDDVLVSATNPTTGQTKAVTLKLSGGCNCHVNRISGVDVVAFD
jgi:predicted secreted protein